MFGIDLWDWSSLLLYFVIVTVSGVWTARKVKDTADFFIGGRRFGKVFMLFFAFGVGTSGNDAVAVSSKTYTNGMSGIWYQWLWLFATPFYWIIAPVFRRMRAVTTGDFFEIRFNKATAALYSFIGVLTLTLNIGVLLLGVGSTITAVSGGAISTFWAILCMTVIFVLYGVAGGLGAAIVTDFLQGILTVVLSFIILPFAWRVVGGIDGLRAGISDSNFFSLVAPGEINGFHIFMFAFNALIGIVTQPHIMGVCAAGQDEMDGRVGFTCGNLLKRICTIAWMLTGFCGIVYFANKPLDNPDLVYGQMARDLLPAALPGLVGLFLASLLASIMSSCDGFMVSSAGLFTQNIYRVFLVKNRSESHYVLVGRIASVVVVVTAILFAVNFKNVPTALEWFFRLQAVMGPAFWLGLFWRRTTVAGAWSGTLTAFALVILTSREFFHHWAVQYLPSFMIWNNEFRVSWQMFTYLVGGFGTCFVVSLFTSRVPDERLDRIYACLRTPVLSQEPHKEPFTLPEGVQVPTVRKLIPHPDWEIPMPSFVGVAGFLATWAVVFIMIGFVYWLSWLMK